MERALQEIVDFLNRAKVRATYGAVAEVLGLPARSIGPMLGRRRREVSWIVNAKTGTPTGYDPEDYHPDLFASSGVIADSGDLRRLMETGG